MKNIQNSNLIFSIGANHYGSGARKSINKNKMPSKVLVFILLSLGK